MKMSLKAKCSRHFDTRLVFGPNPDRIPAGLAEFWEHRKREAGQDLAGDLA